MLQSTSVRKDLRRNTGKPQVAYVVEARLPGGTSSAVAAELEAILPLAEVEVFAVNTAMFSDRPVAPQLGDVLMRNGIPFHMDPEEISADTVIFHNPSCLKFQSSLDTRILTRHLIVVTHENFLRPRGEQAFDVEKCLSTIAARSLALKRSLAPISPNNRDSVRNWMSEYGMFCDWDVLSEDWFNVVTPKHLEPTQKPKDRRGRLSRPGFEKFPSRKVLDLCFPDSAESNIILGAENLMQAADPPAHWSLHPFGALSVEQFFQKIDFFVYYTAPTWQESFGRVVAEAIAAGKIVIADEAIAKGFQGAAIGAPAQDVSGIIADYLADPAKYVADVKRAQDALQRFSPGAFRDLFGRVVGGETGEAP